MSITWSMKLIVAALSTQRKSTGSIGSWRCPYRLAYGFYYIASGGPCKLLTVLKTFANTRFSSIEKHYHSGILPTWDKYTSDIERYAGRTKRQRYCAYFRTLNYVRTETVTLWSEYEGRTNSACWSSCRRLLEPYCLVSLIDSSNAYLLDNIRTALYLIRTVAIRHFNYQPVIPTSDDTTYTGREASSVSVISDTCKGGKTI